MADKTGISWTDATWNPVRGCSRVSAGCVNCYAEAQAARIVRMGKGKPTAYDGLVEMRSRQPLAPVARWTGVVRLVPEQLAWPLRKRKPLRIFVNSMSDLFHESLTNEQIAAVFGVMAACPQHTFQVLTKRATRMREWFEWVSSAPVPFGGLPEYEDHVHARQVCCRHAWMLPDSDERLARREVYGLHPSDDVLEYQRGRWPLPNVWLGVSVENQEAADERIPELLRTPAAVRFLSCEPLLGKVDLLSMGRIGSYHDYLTGERLTAMEKSTTPRIDWVIAGCESGPGARPCSIEWLRSLRDQCAAAGVALFLKQATAAWAHGPNQPPPTFTTHFIDAGAGSHRKPGGVIELPYLDGVQHAAFPLSQPEKEASMRASGQRPAPLVGEAHDD